MNGRQQGWVLFEVVAAAALFAVLVGGLAGAALAAHTQGNVVADRVAGVEAGDGGNRQPWTWGGPALRVSWTPGPALKAWVPASEDAPSLVVGVWVSGWLVGEIGPDADGLMTVSSSSWRDRTGEEVVLRSRTADGAWGAPWRTVVPDVAGVMPVVSGGTTGPGASVGSVIHPSSAASSTPDSAGTRGTLMPGESGLPFLASSLPTGTVGARWEGLDQLWISESYRSIDVYF
jgi:hypothetical protein